MSSHVRRRTLDIWPGFVDALAALLMVVIFVLLLFTLGQFFLTDALSGRERALDRLNRQVAELGDLLALEKVSTATLEQRVANLTASLTSARSEGAQMARDLSAARDTITEKTSELANLASDIVLLRDVRARLEQEVAALAGDLDQSRRDTQMQSELSAQAQAQVIALNRQIIALREQLGAVSEALELTQSQLRDRDLAIEDLGQRLNVALASKVQELANYRSEFFGRLKQALGDNPDLRIEGDRFVFQSELLFATGSAELGDQGRAQVRRLANTLAEIGRKIPTDLDWVLRVDGHTDKRPIATTAFPSNWELSTARALAIVRYLIALGIQPQRLAATGFGQHHPLDARDNELAFARNRRIELKLTSR